MESDFDDVHVMSIGSEDCYEMDNVKAAESCIKVTWASRPPNAETDIIGKWYGVIWQGKRNEVLNIAHLVKRFLVDEDGPVKSILMLCLKRQGQE